MEGGGEAKVASEGKGDEMPPPSDAPEGAAAEAAPEMVPLDGSESKEAAGGGGAPAAAEDVVEVELLIQPDGVSHALGCSPHDSVAVVRHRAAEELRQDPAELCFYYNGARPRSRPRAVGYRRSPRPARWRPQAGTWATTCRWERCATTQAASES